MWCCLLELWKSLRMEIPQPRWAPAPVLHHSPRSGSIPTQYMQSEFPLLQLWQKGGGFFPQLFKEGFIQLFLSIRLFIDDAHHNTFFVGLPTLFLTHKFPTPTATPLHKKTNPLSFSAVYIFVKELYPSTVTLWSRELFHHACHCSKPWLKPLALKY